MHELTIEGVIGWDVTSTDIRNELQGKSGDLTVFINSIGGDVFDGLSILNQLSRHPGTVAVMVDGLAASAASFIAMAGDTVTMGTGAQMMIHDPWTVTIGDLQEHTRAIEMLDKSRGSILDAYGKRVDDREQLGAWMTAETWFSADEAVEAGLADGVDAALSAVAATVPKGMFRHAPAALVSPEAEPIKSKVWKAVALGHRAQIERLRV